MFAAADGRPVRKRADRIVRPFDTSHGWRSRNGVSAWRSITTRVPLSRMPASRAPQHRRQRLHHRRVRIGGRRHARLQVHRLALQAEPVGGVRAEGQEVRLLGEARERREPAHLHGDEARVRLQVELRRLHAPRQVDHDEDRLAVVATEECEDLPIRAADEEQRPAAEHAVLPAHRDQARRPVEQREGGACRRPVEQETKQQWHVLRASTSRPTSASRSR